jgi:glucose/arabinose dehydrogenase
MKRTLFFAALFSAIPHFTLIAQPLQLVNAFPNLTFTSPVLLTHPPDGTNRIFVVQQNGIIRVFPNDSAVTSAKTFLNVSSRISTGSERGLLGLAFHPNYASNGYFYIDYTQATTGRTIVARYSVNPANPDTAIFTSEQVLLDIYQPFSNHNGGNIMFGLDGYLYIGLGDGGSAGDPGNRAQNLDSLLGKILRIDVNDTSGGRNYGIPVDNPLIGSGHREEIFAWGLRNPWRFSQDPVTGTIWVGDVGQGLWEEIDILEKGLNCGWRCYEGNARYDSSGCGPSALYTFPVKVYPHSGGDCSVTGGYVYRGNRRPELVGRYIYADYCTGKIWQFIYQNGHLVSDSLLIDAPFSISSFGVDQSNELYICNFTNGNIQRFAGNPTNGVGQDNELPTAFALYQNYPNPFNGSTIISFDVPEPSDIRIRVYNLLGAEVGTLVNGRMQPGTHTVTINAEALSSGVYFYAMETSAHRLVRKLMLMR